MEIAMGNFANPAAYELWMGRWSKRLAPVFVAFAGWARGTRVLDVGSGTGGVFQLETLPR